MNPRASDVFDRYSRAVQHPCRPSPPSCLTHCETLSSMPGWFAMSIRFLRSADRFSRVETARTRASSSAARACPSAALPPSVTSHSTLARAGRTPDVQQILIRFSARPLSILSAPHAFFRRTAKARSRTCDGRRWIWESRSDSCDDGGSILCRSLWNMRLCFTS